MGSMPPQALDSKACAFAVARIAIKTVEALGTHRFRCAVHIVRTRPPLVRFPGRLPHPKAGLAVRTAFDLTYDVSIMADGTLSGSLLETAKAGKSLSAHSDSRELLIGPSNDSDASDALLLALSPRPATVWDSFCGALGIDRDAATFRARLRRRPGGATLEGATAGTEGSHRVGRYADRAPVRSRWTARWRWSRQVARIDLDSSIAHGAPQAVELRPRAFSPLYTERIATRIVLRRLPGRD